jgi:hypothetical protein
MLPPRAAAAAAAAASPCISMPGKLMPPMPGELLRGPITGTMVLGILAAAAAAPAGRAQRKRVKQGTSTEAPDSQEGANSQAVGAHSFAGAQDKRICKQHGLQPSTQHGATTVAVRT